MTDVLVVGGAGVDTIVRVDSLPVPLADSHVVPPIDTVVGHTGSGVALGCHRLGLETCFVDVIGDDHEGRMLVSRFAAEGLRFEYVLDPSGTRRAVNLVDPAGRLHDWDGRNQHHQPFAYAADLVFVSGSRLEGEWRTPSSPTCSTEVARGWSWSWTGLPAAG